jgi:hypothetical protein
MNIQAHVLLMGSLWARSPLTLLSRYSFTSTLALNDPLQTLFQLMSGRIPQAATVLSVTGFLLYPRLLRVGSGVLGTAWECSDFFLFKEEA